MQSSIRCFNVKKEDIAYFKFILEGYQGLAMMRTLDPLRGLVLLHIPPGAEREVSQILEGLIEELCLTEVALPPSENDIEMDISPDDCIFSPPRSPSG